MEHEVIPPGEIHAPHNWVVADEAARLALVVTEADLGKYCWQRAGETEWFLIGHTPAVWKQHIGPAGGATTVTVGATPISGHTAVALDSGGLLVYADCTNLAHLGAVLGVVANAYGAGDLAVVQTDFDLAHAGWTFATGPVFVGATGALVQTLPMGAVFAQVVGYALAPTRIRIDVQPPIVLT